MPTSGLSLVGFLEKEAAIYLLRNACVSASLDDVALELEWQRAKNKLQIGIPPVPNPGKPAIAPVPEADKTYIDALIAQSWVSAYLSRLPQGFRFSAIELDPLLVWQFNVDIARSEQLCSDINSSSTIGDLMPICLPQDLPKASFQQHRQAQSMMVRSHGLNFLKMGRLGPNIIGMIFGVPIPLLQVVRLRGRYYLYNGFHRVIGMRRRGILQAPCLLSDVATAEDVGIRSDGGTFSEALLNSDNPPTIAHFVERAWPVQLRIRSHILHLSWSEYSLPEE